jgi:hypothetical protein
VLPVVDDGSAEAPGRVDAGAGDGDGGEVDQEHCEPNRQWGKDLLFRRLSVLTINKDGKKKHKTC